MEVEFVTLGGASDRLNVPPPTLRGWADRFEDLKIHYLERNHRDERIFYAEDIEIFKFVRDSKERYGRKTTTTDIAYMISSNENFKCRRFDDVPEVPAHKAKLGELDITNVLQHEDFKAFIENVIEHATNEATERLKENIRAELSEEFKKNVKEIEDNRIDKLDEYMEEQRKTQEMMQAYAETPVLKRIFKKNPFKKEQ